MFTGNDFEKLGIGIIVFEVKYIKGENEYDIIFKYGNNTLYKLFNIDKEEINDKSSFQLLLDFNDVDLNTIYTVATKGTENKFIKFYKDINKYFKTSCFQSDINFCTCLIEDITEQYIDEKQVRINGEKYKIAIENTNDIIFDYFPIEKEIKYTKSIIGFQNFQKVTKDIPNQLVKQNLIHLEDRNAFLKMFDIIKDNKTTNSVVRIQNDDNRYLWYKVILNNIYDEEGQVLSIFGLIKNIDDLKRNELELQFKAESDSLTGLYNKKATEILISDYLKAQENKKSSHAMIIIDIDNFKEVNDFLGHVIGDSLLLEISNRIKTLFRQDDIIGRIGGDEFMIFMKNLKNVNSVINKVKNISTILKDKYDHLKININITTSIGISFYPNEGTDFISLYKNADIAMYEAKDKGDCYSVFNSDISVNKAESKSFDYNASVLRKKFALNIADDILRILYGNENITQNINEVLELLSKYYNFTRATINQIKNDNIVNVNSYLLKESIKTTKFEKYHHNLFNNLKLFTANENYFTYDFPKLDHTIKKYFKKQSIKSIYIFPFEENQYTGFIEFDNSINKVHLKKEQIHELTIVSNILALYVLKKKNCQNYKIMA